MVQRREDLALGAKASQVFGGAQAADDLERDLRLVFAVITSRDEHRAHAATPDLAFEQPRSETLTRARLADGVVRGGARGITDDVPDDDARGLVRGEQRLDLPPQALVAVARGGDERRALVRR
jgi:hypothetical protein